MAEQPLVPATESSPSALPPSAPGALPCAECVTIPALTPVKLELLATLGSKLSKSGEMFPIRLAEPIFIDGREVVAAGATGMGEVVHAKKSGGMGAAGELVLAARYLDIGGQRLRLRSMSQSPSGRSNIGTVNTINVASAASPLPIGLIGFFIKGGQVTIEQGSIADAKTASAFTLVPAEPASPVMAQVIEEKGKTDEVQ